MNRSGKAIIGLLGSVFSAVSAAPASARSEQDLAGFGYGSTVAPYEDINISVTDVYQYTPENREPGVYHFGQVNCGAGASSIQIFQFNTQTSQKWLSDDFIGGRRDYPGIKQLVFGTDGQTYDLKQPEIYRDFMAGTLKTGVKPDTTAFLKAVRSAAEYCLPQF